MSVNSCKAGTEVIIFACLSCYFSLLCNHFPLFRGRLKRKRNLFELLKMTLQLVLTPTPTFPLPALTCTTSIALLSVPPLISEDAIVSAGLI